MPEITEAKLYEAFGLNPPETEPGAGAQEQEPAAPAAEVSPASADEGAQEQELAEPAGADVTEEPDDHSEPTAESAENDNADPGQSSGKEPLTTQQRRENAARRRQQEQQAAIDQAVNAALQAEREKNDAFLKNFFERMGLKDTATGQPITTVEQFNAWQSAQDAQQINKDLKAGRLTAEQLNQLISNHPAVKQAQQVVHQTEQAQVQQRQAADQSRIDSELAEIAKLNPNIKGVGDLLSIPKSDVFRSYVQKGMGFLDAYKLTHMEELTAAKAEAATQQAMNNARGKDHLNATGNSRGNGAVAVPAAVMASYRAINPNATDAEIQAHYNKFIKQ